RVDNLSDGSQHAAALAYLVDDFGPSHPVSVATGYANLNGLHHLAGCVTDGRVVRLLLGAAPDPGLGVELPLGRFQLALETLRQDRDLSRFPPSRAAARLANVEEWLAEASVRVRRYLAEFLHGK